MISKTVCVGSAVISADIEGSIGHRLVAIETCSNVTGSVKNVVSSTVGVSIACCAYSSITVES